MDAPFSRTTLRGATLAVWVAVCLAITGPAFPAPRVQVRGSSRVELRAVGAAQQIRITGILRDEIGTPIPGASIVLTALAAPDAPISWESAKACNAPPTTALTHHAEHLVQTDDAGAFCVEAALARREAGLQAVFGGDALHEGTRTDVRWDAGLRPVGLAFAPRLERIDLDAPRTLVFARLTAPDGVSPAKRELTLENDQGQTLGAARTDEAGAAHFDIPSTKFEGPGIGNVRLRFAGTEELTSAQETATVIRSSRVRLGVESSALSGDPTRGVGFVVHAVSARGDVEGGSIEATWGTATVGVARVERGRAKVVAVVTPPRDDTRLDLTIRYLPDAPYYEPGPSVPVAITVSKPRLWLRVVPIGVAIFVAAWLLRGWRRPRRRAVAVPPATGHTGEPALAVVGSAKARSTWSGKVVDAHEGTPIADARVRVIAPSFADLDVIVEVRTSHDGRFEFRVDSAERELRLRVEGPLHAHIERPLPPASEMVVAMLSRRRALVERLVAWARRAGRPWDKSPEPTPGHVARVAYGQRHPREDIGVWARKLENRAYGPEPVDAAVEREVGDIEPGGPAVR